jgi:hypothetical protein
MNLVYNCYWSSPAQSFSGPSPAGLVTIFLCVRFETSPNCRTGSHIYIPQEQGGLGIAPSTEFSCRRLLQLTGLRWRYSTLPPLLVLRSRSIICTPTEQRTHCLYRLVKLYSRKRHQIITSRYVVGLLKVDTCFKLEYQEELTTRKT